MWIWARIAYTIMCVPVRVWLCLLNRKSSVCSLGWMLHTHNIAVDRVHVPHHNWHHMVSRLRAHTMHISFHSPQNVKRSHAMANACSGKNDYKTSMSWTRVYNNQCHIHWGNRAREREKSKGQAMGFPAGLLLLAERIIRAISIRAFILKNYIVHYYRSSITSTSFSGCNSCVLHAFGTLTIEWMSFSCMRPVCVCVRCPIGVAMRTTHKSQVIQSGKLWALSHAYF